MAWLMIGAALMAAADKPASNPLMKALAKCLEIRTDAERLACTDVAARRLVDAERSRELVIVNRDEVKRAKRSLFGLPVDENDVFAGREGPSERIDRVESEVVSVAASGRDRVTLALKEGGSWRTNEPWTSSPRAGMIVTIRRAAMGSYMLTGKGLRGVRVQRCELMRRPRSALYLPASNARTIAKARDLPCDAVILDLEDAVAPQAKEQARAQAVAALQEGGFGDRVVVVRVNGLDTPWGAADCAAVKGVAATVLLPKVEAPDHLARARALLGPHPALWAMVETCAAVLALPILAGAAAENGLTALVAGTNDLAKDMRCRPDTARTPLLQALSQIVTAARAAGLLALDGVLNSLGDAKGLAAECRQGAMLGFDGKTLIHPAQIDVANAAFGPDAAAIAWAGRVVEAFAAPEAAGKGAIRLDGEMVERLHLAEAERLLAY